MTFSDSSLLAEAGLLQDPPRRAYFGTIVAPEAREVYVDPVRAEDPAAWGRGEPVHEIHFVSSDDASRTGWLVGVRYGPGDESLGWDTFWIHHVPEGPDVREDALRWGMRLALVLEVPLTGEATPEGRALGRVLRYLGEHRGHSVQSILPDIHSLGRGAAISSTDAEAGRAIP